MSNPRLAGRYAKSLIDLAIERNQLEEIHSDMQYLHAVCKGSRDFVNMLRSPVIKGDKKDAVIAAITQGKISIITTSFIKLLVAKGREEDLPEVVDTVIEQYNKLKNINKIKLTTASSISDDLKEEIIHKFQEEAGLENIQLETKTDESLIGGFVLEFNNNLVDASISKELKEIKKQFGQNIYIHNLR